MGWLCSQLKIRQLVIGPGEPCLEIVHTKGGLRGRGLPIIIYLLGVLCAL